MVFGQVTGESVPLGREPVFLRLGSIIPMDVERDYTGHGTRESAGALTVLVYPSGRSTFRYYEDSTATWTTFTSTLSGSRLTLEASPLPAEPILYRVGRMATAPTSVGVDGETVTINQDGDIPEVASEREVNGSTKSAWYYDAPARRLIIKFVH